MLMHWWVFVSCGRELGMTLESLTLWFERLARYVMLCYVMFCYVMLFYVIYILCCVMLCYVMLCYEPYAQTFYMCLESPVGCMTETVGYFTCLAERFYGISLSTFGPRTCLNMFDAFWSNFKGILKEM